MKLSLKPHHLKRYKDIAMLFLKYGNSDLAKEFEHADAGDEKKPEPAKPGQQRWTPIFRPRVSFDFCRFAVDKKEQTYESKTQTTQCGLQGQSGIRSPGGA